MATMYDFAKVQVHWFPSHMKTGLDRMRRLLTRCNLVLEVGGYVPLSSANPLLDSLCRGRQRLIIFNKSDLAEPRVNARLERYAEGRWPGQTQLLSNQGQDSYRELLHRIARLLRAQPEPRESSTLLVVGVPNVGKSTVINRLRALGTQRGGRAVKVGDQPGITRSLSGLVKILEEPLAYLVDTPGVLMPKIQDSRQGMNLAVSGALMDQVVGDYLLVDYLFAFLREQAESGRAMKALKLPRLPSNSLSFVEEVAKANGMVNSNGSTNHHNATRLILNSFRQGTLGLYTLDHIPDS